MRFPWKEKAVPFERFMEFALYHPRTGYYTSGRRVFGRRGDYFTSAHTHPFFAHCLGDWVADAFERLGRPHPFHLVELGAGEGALGREMVAHLERAHTRVAEALRYQGLEVGSRLEGPLSGVVVCNEFFDALPVRLIRVRQGELREVWVRTGETIEEEERPIEEAAVREYMDEAFGSLEEGWLYEVNLRMVRMLEELDRQLRSAILLTLDYGYCREEYRQRARPQGTLLCYHRHHVSPDPYRLIGEQDMTAHISFDVLRARGRHLGWRNLPLFSQRRFLMEWGLRERLVGEEARGLFAPDRLESRLGLARLLRPGGISDTLKVLEQEIRVPG